MTPWLGTILQATGALWLACNISTSRYAYFAMLPGSLIWVAIAYTRADYALMAMSVVFVLINAVGLWRWSR